MPKWISESELQRIQEFAESPKYRRSPEMLMPESEGEDSTVEEFEE